MNKKTFIILILIFIVLVGVVYYGFLVPNKKDSHGCLSNKGHSWCDFKEKCVKAGEEDCNLNQNWVLGEAKKIMGLDLSIMPNESVEWNTKDGEVAFSSQGFIYTDILGAEKITKSYTDIENLLKKIGFQNDSYNPPVNTEKEKSIKYNKEKIVCALSRTDNSNGTSSLLLLCGNTDEKFCNFNSNCGRECANDSDCGLMVDGCAKKDVCRNKNYKFYQDCANPTSDVGLLDTRINSCSCIDNKCQPTNEKYRSQN